VEVEVEDDPEFYLFILRRGEKRWIQDVEIHRSWKGTCSAVKGLAGAI
jgi:hypothetical protein